MSEAAIHASILIITCLLCYVFTVSVLYEEKPVNNIYEVATRDCSMLGDIRNIDSVMFRYFKQLLIKAYNKNLYTPMSAIIVEWCNAQPSPDLLLKANGEAISFIWGCIDEAENKGTEVDFKVYQAYDYHVLPKSLMYNDYVDMESLIERADKLLLGGDSDEC